MNTRTESDSMGQLDVPEDALYGAQTQRAVLNFNVSGQRMPEGFIRALLTVKRVAAATNAELGALDDAIANAIVNACDQLLALDNLLVHFPVDVFQTGSGTSSNMNANEVIARLACQSSTCEVHPNDHVNCGQSSNDVIPTSIHVSAALSLHNHLVPALEHLIAALKHREPELAQYCKTGRTHLMDAMPVRLDQTIAGWRAQLQQQLDALVSQQGRIQNLAIGGTAVGTGVNAHPEFAKCFAQKLSAHCGIAFTPAINFFALIGSQDSAVNLSGACKGLAVTLMKIANDLRWMNSGPLGGLGEIILPALQPGSSIMPGKVNPVVPEAVAMAAAQVIGNDTAITVGGQSGNFELNVMLPVIAHNLLTSMTLLTNSCCLLADKAIADFTVNREGLEHALHRNPILVTALNPIIGYAKAAEIAKQAYTEKRPIIDVADEVTDIPRDELTRLLDPYALTDNQKTQTL